MAKITASVYTSHVPAIGAALDLGPQDARVIIRVDAQGAQSLATD